MRRTSILYLTAALAVAGALVSCGETSASSAASSAVSISGVDIIGPQSVEVGKTIRLTADVLGSDVDTVLWSSSDEAVAAVSEDGTVTGISAGTAVICATSTENSTYFGTYAISVTLPKTDSFSLTVRGSEDISYDAALKVYSVPLGLDFSIAPVFAAGVRTPDVISYSIVYPSGASASMFTLDHQEDNSALVHPMAVMEGVVVKVTASYSDMGSDSLIQSLTFNVTDLNAENLLRMQSLLGSIAAREREGLLSSSVTRTAEISQEEVLSQSIEHLSYTDATYISRESGASVENYYSGSHLGTYYCFSYGEDGTIGKVYENAAMQETDPVGMYFEVQSDVPVYGHSGILSNFFSSTHAMEYGLTSFGNAYCYAYAEFLYQSDFCRISSQYTDPYNGNAYSVLLEISYSESTGELTSYRFYETADTESGRVVYEEKAENFVYGTKTADSSLLNDLYLDMDIYYLTSFDLVEIAGTSVEGSYNYSDLTKYGSDSVSEENGMVKYTLTYDKTLVLEVSSLQPATATVLIDTVTAKSSDTSQIPDVSAMGGIFAISAGKNDEGLSQPGQATFTFTSKKGVERSVIVCFVDSELKGLNVTNVPSGNAFGDIFVGDCSSYFFLNTDPDESKYSFNIEILSGPEQGIELYRYENGNLDGYPGFSYAIRGRLAGSYAFRFYVEQYPEIVAEGTYSIEVLEPYGTEYLRESLVAPKAVYEYNTGTMDLLLTFASDTELTLSQTLLGGSEMVQTIAYHLEAGAVVIEDGQTFDEDFYFSSALGGKAPYSADFDEIRLYLCIGDTAAYTPITFRKVVDKSDLAAYLSGKNFSCESFIVGYGMCVAEVSFQSGAGVFRLRRNSDSSVVTEVTFRFVYNADPAVTSLVLSDIQGTGELSLTDASGYYNTAASTLEFRLTDGTILRFAI